MATATAGDIGSNGSGPTEGRWEQVEAEGNSFRRGDAVLTFDGTTVRVVRDGTTWEEGFGHPDHLAHHGGFPAILDSWLSTVGLPDGVGLEQACTRVEEEFIEAEIAAQVRRYEEQLFDAQVKLDDAREAVDEMREESSGSFAERVSQTRVNLVEVMRGDLTPPPEIEGSGGVLLEGVRHLWPMDRKGGKSIATEVTAVDIVLAGGRVVILDRENGERRYALRLKDIADARKLTEDHLTMLEERLSYYAYPRLRKGDREEMVREMEGADLVVFDSSRMFLSSLNLRENESDDYAEFMAELIEPLHREGIATLILDNAGWSDSGRPRGSSAKEDLNEQLFHAEKSKEFDINTTGEILLGVKESRDGVTGTWSMRIGGGVYDPWEKSHRHVGQKEGKPERMRRMRELLAADPAMSDEDLAEELGLSTRTVERYRKELAAEG